VQLFGRGAQLLKQPRLDGHAELVITACSCHGPHLQYLLELTQQADGVITPKMVKQLQISIISRQKFEQLIKEKAHRLWERGRGNREMQDWDDAWHQLDRELGHIPSRPQQKVRAEQLHQGRKEAQAREDWLQAERCIAQLFTVAA